jgi:hypothetical protein
VGYQRIVGELKGLGLVVSATTVRIWLRAEGLGSAGTGDATITLKRRDRLGRL